MMMMMMMCCDRLLVRGNRDDPEDYSTCVHLSVRSFPSENHQALNASGYFYAFSGKYIIHSSTSRFFLFFCRVSNLLFLKTGTFGACWVVFLQNTHACAHALTLTHTHTHTGQAGSVRPQAVLVRQAVSGHMQMRQYERVRADL